MGARYFFVLGLIGGSAGVSLLWAAATGYRRDQENRARLRSAYRAEEFPHV